MPNYTVYGSLQPGSAWYSFARDIVVSEKGESLVFMDTATSCKVVCGEIELHGSTFTVGHSTVYTIAHVNGEMKLYTGADSGGWTVDNSNNLVLYSSIGDYPTFEKGEQPYAEITAVTCCAALLLFLILRIFKRGD